MATFFSDFFDVDDEALDACGAFNISLVNDLPLFIDPFLLFNSAKAEYQRLHNEIIKYLIFLRDRAISGRVNDGLLRLWYCFPEIKQNWLGFSVSGNAGSGLGIDFARALHQNLHLLYSNFGDERISKGSHLEKICLIADGVGRDNVSDFTTNLIKEYLSEFTQRFALEHLDPNQIKSISIDKVRFNYETESWERATYRLPWVNDDYVILTPKDILTRDDNWINRGDLIHRFEDIPTAISDAETRAQVSNYFERLLARSAPKHPSSNERSQAASATIRQFPQLIDYYIKLKEDEGDDASSISAEKVTSTERVFVHQVNALQLALAEQTRFYEIGETTYDECHTRLAYLKDVIENKGGHRIFYDQGKPIEREKDLQVLYRLVWFGSPSDVGTEANDGRGPVDFKISRGAADKTLVEMKLAKNTQLQRNLQRQVQIYEKASDAKKSIKVILFFTRTEEDRVKGILDKLGLLDNKDIVLIDARNDNKPSGSRA